MTAERIEWGVCCVDLLEQVMEVEHRLYFLIKGSWNQNIVGLEEKGLRLRSTAGLLQKVDSWANQKEG